MGTPIQTPSLYGILRDLGITADDAHNYDRKFEQEIIAMVDKELASYATKVDLVQAIAEVKHEIQAMRADLLKAINDQSKWMIRTFLSVAGLTVVMSGLLVKLM